MRIRLATLLFPLLAACSIESGSTSSADGGDRGGLGKADLVGTCEWKGNDLCGGKGKGNCWCDESCVEYGDCCSDVDEVCGIEEPAPEGVPCGGWNGDTCSDDEYCAYEPGQYCGQADASSVCEPRPDACIALYQPVCGCDGETYSNSCHAASAGTGVMHDGPCDPPAGEFCGGFGNLPCPEGQQCVDDPSDGCDPNNGGADCGGVCVPAAGCEPVACELFCENGFATDENGCEICSCNEVDVCGPIEADLAAEAAAVRACQSDDECGQVMTGTSCGCTRNWVARTDADLGTFEELRTQAEENGCELPGGISTCDCPATDGFACEQNVCTWNYL